MAGGIRVLNCYFVFVGEGILTKLSKLINLNKYSSFFLITDESVERHWSKKIEEIIPDIREKIILKPGEQSKNIINVQKIWQKLLLSGSDRKTLVINLGGGVIGDIGGFAASTYMRGIDFLQIPTTLLSQVDSSVGGKVGVNFLNVKNLIGTFDQPVGVICDINLLSTLPDKEFVSGFAEIIKHGIVADKKYFDFVTSKTPRSFNKKELVKIVTGSVKIKARIVEEDEKETGKRKSINFGHTIGHAVEALSRNTNYPLCHGEAISIGLVLESKISEILGLISKHDFNQIKEALRNADLPVTLPDFSFEALTTQIKTDKKSEKGKINWTLVQGIGRAAINQIIDDRVLNRAIKETL